MFLVGVSISAAAQHTKDHCSQLPPNTNKTSSKQNAKASSPSLYSVSTPGTQHVLFRLYIYIHITHNIYSYSERKIVPFHSPNTDPLKMMMMIAV